MSDIPIARPRHEARVLLLMAACHLLLAAAAGLAIRRHPLPIWGATGWIEDWWYVGGFKLLGMLGVALALMARWRIGLRDVLAGWRPSPRALLTVAAAFGAGLAVNLGRWPRVVQAARDMDASEAAARAAAGVAIAFLAAALPEELAYRALLQTRLEAAWGRLSALVVTALLFTAWHLPSRYLLSSGVEGMAGQLGSVLVGTGAPVLVAALLLGWSWDRHRNLPALIAFHWGIDSIPVVAMMLKAPAW